MGQDSQHQHAGGPDESGPPPPPDMPRRLRSTGRQIAGIVLIALVPILALTGWLGDSTARAHATAGTIEIDVLYPTTLRYRNHGLIEVRLRQAAAGPAGPVSIEIDTAYVSRFTEVRSTPGAERVLSVELAPLQPAEERVVTVELRAERRGRHHGELRVATGGDTARVRISTFVLP
jgi:hypothetical protein